jgi:hypothetical protein
MARSSLRPPAGSFDNDRKSDTATDSCVVDHSSEAKMATGSLLRLLTCVAAALATTTVSRVGSPVPSTCCASPASCQFQTTSACACLARIAIDIDASMARWRALLRSWPVSRGPMRIRLVFCLLVGMPCGGGKVGRFAAPEARHVDTCPAAAHACSDVAIACNALACRDI